MQIPDNLSPVKMIAQFTPKQNFYFNLSLRARRTVTARRPHQFHPQFENPHTAIYLLPGLAAGGSE